MGKTQLLADIEARAEALIVLCRTAGRGDWATLLGVVSDEAREEREGLERPLRVVQKSVDAE